MTYVMIGLIGVVLVVVFYYLLGLARMRCDVCGRLAREHKLSIYCDVRNQSWFVHKGACATELSRRNGDVFIARKGS